MNINKIAILALTTVLCGCSGSDSSGNSSESTEKSSTTEKTNGPLVQARDSVAMLQARIDSLETELGIYRFPPDQRLAQIKELIEQGNYESSRYRIVELQTRFPHSPEAKECAALIADIKKKEEALMEEDKRIKALGFKAFTPSLTATVEPNKVTFSNVKTGKEYTFDYYTSYSTYWYYRTADRDNTYVLADMSVTSTDKNPLIPTLAVYSIEGDELKLQGVMDVRFARWDDYGTYLGNSTDLHNDFAKVSTVKFKLGVEVPKTVVNGPYMVVLRKANTHQRETDRFANPPVSYRPTGTGYPATLTQQAFRTGEFQPVKIANLK